MGKWIFLLALVFGAGLAFGGWKVLFDAIQRIS